MEQERRGEERNDVKRGVEEKREERRGVHFHIQNVLHTLLYSTVCKIDLNVMPMLHCAQTNV